MSSIQQQTERRARGGDVISRALLDAPTSISFSELLAAVPDAAPGEVAGWLGHAVAEGLIDDLGAGPEGERQFRLRARGRRLLSAGRRRSV